MNSVVDLLQWRSSQNADKKAFSFMKMGNGEVVDFSYTFKELEEKARAIASVLQNLRLCEERVVLFFPPASGHFVSTFFGCLFAGAIAVPVYPPMMINRAVKGIQNIIGDAEPKALLTTSTMLNEYKNIIDSLNVGDLHLIATDEIEVENNAKLWKETKFTRDKIAYLQYTSGSTGNPKGVMVSHGSMLHNAQVNMDYFFESRNISREDTVFVSWTPLYHDLGVIGYMVYPIYSGLYCIMMCPLDFVRKPLLWLKNISNVKKGNVISLSPNFGYELCIRKVTEEDKKDLDLSNWTIAFNIAEPVRKDTFETFASKFESCGFKKEAHCQGYGLAECTLIQSAKFWLDEPADIYLDEDELGKGIIKEVSSTDPKGKAFVSAGKLRGKIWRDDIEIIIVDPTSKTEVPPCTEGEIWIKGSSVTKGYWNKKEATDEVFNAYLKDTGAGPYLRTGDLGFVKNRELYITGRLKDIIIIKGVNYYPQDIERTIEQCHDFIRPGRLAAFSIEKDNDEKLIVTVELKRQLKDELESGALKEELKKIKPAIRKAVFREHQVQAYDILVLYPQTISFTSSGKVQRGLNKRRYLNNDFKNKEVV